MLVKLCTVCARGCRSTQDMLPGKSMKHSGVVCGCVQLCCYFKNCRKAFFFCKHSCTSGQYILVCWIAKHSLLALFQCISLNTNPRRTSSASHVCVFIHRHVRHVAHSSVQFLVLDSVLHKPETIGKMYSASWN